MMRVVSRRRKKMLGNDIITSAQTADVPNSIRTGRTAAEILHFNSFQDGGRPPS